MKVFLFLLSIFLLEADTKSNERLTCENPLNYWTNEFPICHLYDYCVTLDENRSQSFQFSTKTGYRIINSHDLPNDFEIQSE